MIGLFLPVVISDQQHHRWQYGSTWITRSGKELWSDQPQPIDYLDMNQIPGVTAAADEQVGEVSYLGSAGLDQTGVVGFAYKSQKLSYRKSYHFFDLGFAAIMSGVNTQGVATTTINQQVTPMPLMDIELSSGKVLTQIDKTTSFEGIRYAWLDGMGYAFPQPVRLIIKQDRKLTTFFIEHDNAKDQLLAYFVLPDVTLDRLRHFTRQPTVRVTGQDAQFHALEDLVDNAMSFIFWQPADVGPVATDHPVAVYCQKDQRGLAIAAGNPLSQPAEITLEIAHPADIAALDQHTTLTRKGSTTAITFNAQPKQTHHAGLGGIVP